MRKSRLNKKVIKIKYLSDKSIVEEDLQYWLKKTPRERIDAVEMLRRQYCGSAERLQRTVRVVQRQQN